MSTAKLLMSTGSGMLRIDAWDFVATGKAKQK